MNVRNNNNAQHYALIKQKRTAFAIMKAIQAIVLLAVASTLQACPFAFNTKGPNPHQPQEFAVEDATLDEATPVVLDRYLRTRAEPKVAETGRSPSQAE